jgi:hypothetical protein
MQLAAAPVSYNQELATPCTFIVINGRLAEEMSNDEQTVAYFTKVEIKSEHNDKTVGMICIFCRCLL